MTGKYDAARESFGEGSLSWTGDRIVAQLVSREYEFDRNHRQASQLTGEVGAPLLLTGKSIARGWARADKLVFPEVKGADVVAIVFRREDTLPARRTLIVYHDGIDKFPMTPNGGDIEVTMPDAGIFRV